VVKSGVLSFVKHQRHFCIVALVAALSGTARAQLTVDAPANTSIVNSPFYLPADAPTCDSQPTASMASSIDSQNEVVFLGTQSLQTMVTVQNTNGPMHTLDVKLGARQGRYASKASR
jgi:hypothetical protein